MWVIGLNSLIVQPVFPGNFKLTGKVKASGSVQSLVNDKATSLRKDANGNNIWERDENDNIIHSNLTAGSFPGLFATWINTSNSTALISAPELPATGLISECYNNMFYGCTSLTKAPELPATNLTDGCYWGMFEGCSSLSSAPELPATNLAEYCYESMFRNCTSLTSASKLPATILADGCYAHMFQGCTSLISAPELPAPTVVDICYAYMFTDCTNLNYIKVGLTDWVGSVNTGTIPTDWWVAGVSPTGTFECPEALVSSEIKYSNSYIHNGWTVKTY